MNATDADRARNMLAEIEPLAEAATDPIARDPHLLTGRSLERVAADAVYQACEASGSHRERLLRAALTLYRRERGLLSYSRHGRRQTLRREIAEAMLKDPDLRPGRALTRTHGIIDDTAIALIRNALGSVSRPNSDHAPEPASLCA